MLGKMTDDEINALAEDIYRDRVFTYHIRNEDLNMLHVIFVPRTYVGEFAREYLKW